MADEKKSSNRWQKYTAPPPPEVGTDPEYETVRQALLGETPAGVEVLPSGQTETPAQAASRMGLAVPARSLAA